MLQFFLFTLAAGLLLFPCFTSARQTPLAEDFFYRVASHHKEIQDKPGSLSSSPELTAALAAARLLCGNTVQKFSFTTVGRTFEQDILLHDTAGGIYLLEVAAETNELLKTVKITVL